MPIIDVIAKKPDFLPLSVPKEYLEKLANFHGDPFVWWAGQLLNYLMRFNSDFQSVVSKKNEILNLNTPCVG
jgi:glycoprotein 6-alpha-L-fucosyltransferase